MMDIALLSGIMDNACIYHYMAIVIFNLLVLLCIGSEYECKKI